MTSSFPKVLVLSTTKISTVTATGSAMRNLFGGWPKDRLAQVHSVGGEADEDLCDRFFHITEADIDRKGKLSKKLRAFITDFDPDTVYYRTIDEPAALGRLALALHEQFGVAVVTHTMDDWLNRMTLAAATPNEKTAAAEAAENLASVIKVAQANLAISDSMSTAMGRDYGTHFQTFHNAIDFDEWRDVERTRSVETDGVFRIRYTGSLAADMSRDSAKDLAHVVDVLAAERRSIRLEFSSAPWWRDVFDAEFRHFKNSRHVGFFDRPDYLQFLADADLAVIPINFDDHSLSYLQHSMSNKAPEYMAAGLPVLCYGPLESATVNYAHIAGWGLCVTERSANELGKAIRSLMDDHDARQALASKTAEIGRGRHNAEANRERFGAALAQR